MNLISLRQWSLLGASAILLSGCAVAQGFSKSEKETVAELAPSKYQPATRDVRNNIETQDNFAQAAFWSHEYQLNPADLEAAIKLSAAVRKMGNPGKAIEIAQTTRAIYPKDPYLTAEYAAALIAAERTDDAIIALDGGLRAAPAYARLWSLKGAALDQIEQYDLARRHYGRALKITPNDPSVLANLGLSYALSGDPATAEKWLRQAASQPGATASIRQNLALVMQLQGKDAAVAEYVPPQGMQNRPNNLRSAPTSQPAQSSTARSYAPKTYGNVSPSSRAAYNQPSVQSKPAYAPRPQSSARNMAPKPATMNRPTQANEFSHRSSFTVVGSDEGGPQSAADAARAAAARSQGQNRKIVVPTGVAPGASSTGNILNQIAKNVGPRQSAPQNAQQTLAQNRRVQSPQPYSAPQSFQDPSVTLRRSPETSYESSNNRQPRGSARRR